MFLNVAPMTREHETFCKAFRKFVTLARQEQFITQQQLSLESGLTRQFISMMERGKRVPSFENFFFLASALGVPCGELCERFDQIYRKERKIANQELAERIRKK
ncbi:MAG: helix-turn-helix domain-containing protein [Fibrobacter sp.]|nr:helix-turn-helix domain-containing protein [Fibrobacter sp.]